MKKILISIIILSLYFISCSKKQNLPEFGIIKFYSGSVKVITASGAKNAELKLILYNNDKIITGNSSRADIQLGDFGIIRIAENSETTLKAILDKAEEYTAKLNSGEILCKIEKLKKGQSVNIETPTAVAGVRGTTFLVKSQKDKSEVAVADGKVSVASKKEPEKKVIVSRNQSAAIDSKNNTLKLLKNIKISDLKKLKSIKKERIIKNLKSLDLKKIKNLNFKSINSKKLNSKVKKFINQNKNLNIKKEQLLNKKKETEIKAQKAKKTVEKKTRDLNKKLNNTKNKLKKFGIK